MGVAAALFFAVTFIVNRVMSLAGSSYYLGHLILSVMDPHTRMYTAGCVKNTARELTPA